MIVPSLSVPAINGNVLNAKPSTTKYFALILFLCGSILFGLGLFYILLSMTLFKFQARAARTRIVAADFAAKFIFGFIVR